VKRLSFRDDRIKSSVAAPCDDFDPKSVLSEMDVARLPKLIPMALCAAREACAMAGLPIGEGLSLEASRKVGLILGTGGGGIDFTLSQLDSAHHGGRASLWTITNATHGNLAGELSIQLGLRGPSLCISTGCASSSDAAGLALELLRGDRAGSPDTYVVVGADAHVRWETLAGMELLRVISTRSYESEDEARAGSRPFDKTRDGFVLGEGAWAMVVERESAARDRGVKPFAKVRGYGVTCDAFHRVRPNPEMEESARAMRLAIEDAGLREEDIEYLQYHGTATQLNDALETHAVKLVFGDRARAIPGGSIKSQIGHPQGACGMAAVVATIAALSPRFGEAFAPPTINLREPDPVCDLNYTPNVAAACGAKIALVNCLAFGAKNSALVIEV